MNPTAEVQLRTGVHVPNILVATTTLALRHLYEAGHGVALYELAELAKNPAHELFGNADKVLDRAGLTQGGVLHAAVRDIVLASFDGEGLDLTLVNPLGGGERP